MNLQNTVCLLDDYQSKRQSKRQSKCQSRRNSERKPEVGKECDENSVRAEVLPFSKHTTYLARLELDELLAYKMLYSELDLQILLGKISALLHREFGKGVVRREKTCFILGHNQFESLVAGLLRVQFYANMEDLPEFNIFGETSTQEGITLTWGIGNTADDAQQDLSRKRLQKKIRRTRRGRKRHHKTHN